MAYDAELAAVLGWLDATDPVAMTHFRSGAPPEIKADGTPVTVADRTIEEMIRRAIESGFPGDAILGEEQGAIGEAARRWIIDPIDGTKNYARGVPVFATLVALEVDGVPAVGAASAPALGTRWWAVRGGGAFRNGERIRVSSVDDLAEAHVCSGDVVRYAGDRLEPWLALCRRAARSRGFGDFWGHLLVAEGALEVMVEFPGLSPWDLAAPKIIVEEAGGRLTSLAGEDRIDAGDALTTNGLLHDEVLGVLNAWAT